MASQYPKFPKGEYNHIDKSLAVVDYYLMAKAAQDALLVTKRKHELAVDAQQKSQGTMLDRLRDTIKELTTSAPGVAQSPEDALHHATQRMQAISGTQAAQRAYLKDVVLSVLPVFCTFNEELFNKAGAKLVEDNAAVISAVRQAEGSRGAATKKYLGCIKNWANVFSDPEFVRGDTEQSKAEFAFNAATRFVDVWRQRARMFLTPVTIEGTAIGTLPPEFRDIWSAAYKKLKFDELKRADLCVPYRHEYSLKGYRKEVSNA